MPNEHKVSAKEFKMVIGYDPTAFYTNSLRRHFMLDQDRSEKKHKWNERMSPSGFGANDCMETYMRNVQKFLRFRDKQLFRVRMGTVIHHGLGKMDKYVPGLLWEKPKVRIAGPRKWEVERNWPEVKGFCPELFMSFKADNILNRHGTPVVVDKKTTYDDLRGDGAPPRPSLSNWTQVVSYINLLNHSGLYDTRFEHGGLIYIDPRQEPFSYPWSLELYFDYTEAAEELCELMNEHRVYHYLGFKKGKVRKCEYPYCTRHGTHDPVEVMCDSLGVETKEYRARCREYERALREKRKTNKDGPKTFRRTPNAFMDALEARLSQPKEA